MRRAPWIRGLAYANGALMCAAFAIGGLSPATLAERVTLRPMPHQPSPPPPTLIPNGDFESGKVPMGWEATPGARFRLETEGDRFLRVAFDSDRPGEVHCGFEPLNGPVRFRGRIRRGKDSKGSIGVRIIVSGKAHAWIPLGRIEALAPDPGRWYPFEVDATLPDVGAPDLFVARGTASTTLDLDDLAIRRLD